MTPVEATLVSFRFIKPEKECHRKSLLLKDWYDLGVKINLRHAHETTFWYLSRIPSKFPIITPSLSCESSPPRIRHAMRRKFYRATKICYHDTYSSGPGCSKGAWITLFTGNRSFRPMVRSPPVRSLHQKS